MAINTQGGRQFNWGSSLLMSSLIYIAVVLKHKMSFSSSISILFLHLSPLHFFPLITLLAGLPIIYSSTHYSACFNIYNKTLTTKHLISKTEAGKQRDKKGKRIVFWYLRHSVIVQKKRVLASEGKRKFRFFLFKKFKSLPGLLQESDVKILCQYPVCTQS